MSIAKFGDGLEAQIDYKALDLLVKNSSKGGEAVLREPKEILEEMGKLDKEGETILLKIKFKL